MCDVKPEAGTVDHRCIWTGGPRSVKVRSVDRDGRGEPRRSEGMMPTAGRIPQMTQRRSARPWRATGEEDTDDSRHELRAEIDRLRHIVAALEAENAAMEMYAAVAAHELVEPLIMSEAYAEIVRERLDPEAHAE